MLLFNFVCVFYLMVLVNSHTISKSIAEYNFDDKSDSLTDIDYTRGRKNRHNVFLHKYRREEEECVTEPIGTKKTVVESTTLSQTTQLPKTNGKIKAYHKFWRKFKKKDKKIQNDRMKRHKRKRITINPRYPNRITAHKNYRLSEDVKRKREASIVVTAKLNKNHMKDKKVGTSATKSHLETRSTLTSTTYDKMLNEITTTLADLKVKYGMNKYSFLPKFNKVFYEYRPYYSDTTTMTSKSTTEETEFPGTAQIEELLNDIKARAMEMIAEQSPAITELLTNAATEATFEADPILTHVGVTSPGFALTTFVSLSNMDDVNKRTVNNPNMVVISDKDRHNISVRSYKEEAYTIAQNVEDILQSQLKKIYKKVKCKVSKQYQEEMKTVRSTLSDEKKKIICKIDKAAKCTPPQNKCTGSSGKECKKCTHKPTKTREVRAGKVTKKMKKITTETTPSIDDFAMLTVYEQILAKTQEDNVMKMLTTNPFLKQSENRIFKRNATSNVPSVSTWYDDDVSVSEMETENVTSEYPFETEDNATTSTDSVEDTSYEGLVDKISFHDYVNGYKHYLNFQKAQAASNFSNLVKFQAHKHHKVDDIGKFILNKIPQLPTRKRRYFFDDSDIDYQDVSTKSDDSWFKKHFYMFIDNGPPKKFHTSETVNLKDVTGGKSNKVGFVSSTLADSVSETRRMSTDEPDQDHINLDDLSKALEDSKHSVYFPIDRVHYQIPTKSQIPGNERMEEGGLAFKIYAPNYISKWFGSKQSRKQKKSANNKGDDTSLKSDRLKRDAKLLDLQNKTNALEVRSTIYATPPTDKPKANNKQRDGCVSIEVVSQPTSIVKLRSNAKQSKLKKMLKKLHLTRNKKKQKRQARVYRFNPFKKLKDIFKGNDDERGVGMSRGYNNDYDVMNSHIETFKPVKYDSVPSMEDLRNQIPNITQYYGAPNDVNVRTPEMMGNKDIEYVKKTTPVKANSDTKTLTFGTHNPEQTLGNVSPIGNSIKIQPATLRFTPSLDDIMNVNIKTSHQTEKPVQRAKGLYHMSLQDIKNEIEKLNRRIYSHDHPESPYFMFTKVFTEMPAYTYTKPKSQRVSNQPENTPFMLNRNDFKQLRTSKKPKKNFFGKKSIDIQDKIDVKTVSDLPKLYEFDDYNNLQEINDDISDRNFKVIIGTPDTIESAVFDPFKSDSKEDKYKTRDDFNDLLLWHGDILSYDSLTSPTWQDFINRLESTQLTTPNLLAMQDELAEMNNLLNHFKDSNFVFPPRKDTLKNNTVEFPYNIEYNAKTTPASNYNKRNDYTDGNYKTMNVITEFDENGPNKYYTTRESAKKNKEITRSGEGNLETIHLDTTVLSYDDTINFITDTPKKISRNSPKPTKSKNKSSVKTRTNEQPQQSFSTPFPMTMGQFELFLKQNDLDVESVTAPILETPNLVDIYHRKPISNTKVQEKVQNNDNKKPANEIDDDLTPEDQIEYLNQELNYLESDLQYINEERRKKYNHDDFTKRPEKEKEVEITIINFDDANKLFKELNTLKAKFKEAKNKSSTSPHVYVTHKAKGTHKVVKINEDVPKKHHNTKKPTTNTTTHHKTAEEEDDGHSIHVYGHSFHYNIHFGPHKHHKTHTHAPKQNQTHPKADCRAHSEDEGYGNDKRLKEKQEVHRFEREAKTTSCESSNFESTKPSVEKPSAALPNPLLWAKFMPMLRSKISLFSKKPNGTQAKDNSTLSPKDKSHSNTKNEKKGKSHTSTKSLKKSKSIFKSKNTTPHPKAMTKTLLRTHKTGSNKESISMETEIEKYNDEKEVTSPLPGVMTTDKHKCKTKAKADAKAVITKDDSMYMEEVPPDDQVYYEFGLKKLPLNLKAGNLTTHATTANFYSLLNELKDSKSKRSAAETFTAKNVAAIEVVVDLYKSNFVVPTTPKTCSTKSKTDETTTNSIQVHIAVPYDDKKRAVDSQRIRKVFSAKMATPVDLEYQIHSVEEINATPSGDDDVALSPGMYLVVDNDTGAFSLKPVNLANHLPLRDVESHQKKSNFSSKVTLSKDFLTAMNQQLLKLYENLTSNINNHKIVSRNAPWDKIKNFFGRDKHRNCKCKVNRTMCRACADSDEVVKELTIAFDNLSKYMNDHCHEIQTFFWMNPKGGKKLRDLVGRIDNSLIDHYKRIKGKCQERPCKTFTTYLDKRGVNKSLDELNSFLECMKELSDNIEMVLKSLPYNDSLKDAGEKFVEATNDCAKFVDKRRSETKTEYALDNINVNIICDPAETTSSPKDIEFTYNPHTIQVTYDSSKKEHKKTLRKFFSGSNNNRPRNKLFTYYVSDVTPKMDKRETFNNQLESPLIADTGGSFWQDYIGKNNDLNSLTYLVKKEKTKATTTVKQETKVKKTTSTSTKQNKSFKDKLKNLYPSKLFPTPTPKTTNSSHKVTQLRTTPTNELTLDDLTVTHEESLSHNINELMKIFEKVYHYDNEKNDNNTVSTTHKKTTKHKHTKTKKIKHIDMTTKAMVYEKVEPNQNTEDAEQNSESTQKKGEEKVFDIVFTTGRNNCLTNMVPLQSETTDALKKTKLDNATVAADKEDTELAITVSTDSTLETTEIEPQQKSFLNKLKQVTAKLFNGNKHKTNTSSPKHSREAHKLMTQIKKQTTKGLVTKKGNSKSTTKSNKKTSEDDLLFLQQIRDNQTETGEDITMMLSDGNTDLETNDTETTSEISSLIYKIEDGQQHVISEETTENAILIVTPQIDEGTHLRKLFRSILDFERKWKKREFDDSTTMDIEDIMMTYSNAHRKGTTKKRKKQKAHARAKAKDHTNKHKLNTYTTTSDVEYDLINELKTLELELPSPTGMTEDQKGFHGFSIQIVPNKGHKKHKGNKVLHRNRRRKYRRLPTVTPRDVKYVVIPMKAPKDVKTLRHAVFNGIIGYVLFLILAVGINLIFMVNRK